MRLHIVMYHRRIITYHQISLYHHLISLMNGRGWAKDCTSEELRAVFSTYGTVMVSGLSLLQNVNSWNMIGINWNWKVISMSGTINCCFMLFLTMLLRWHMCMSHRRCLKRHRKDRQGMFIFREFGNRCVWPESKRSRFQSCHPKRHPISLVFFNQVKPTS